MKSPRVTHGENERLLGDIVRALTSEGVPQREYVLNEILDVDALEQLVGSTSTDLNVRFTVEGIRLSVTKDGVDVLEE